MGDEHGRDTFAVPGEELLDDLHAWLTSYVAFPSSHAAVAVTLWAAHTHLVDAFESTPRLALLSPEPQCGKTRVLELLNLICRGAEMLSDASPAYVFRRIGAAHRDDESAPVTALIDEADAIWKRGGDESAEGLRSIVNAGHRKGATVGRVEMAGQSARLVRFPVYAPVALACKGDRLPDTILTRSVVVRMRRRAPDEDVRSFRERIATPEGWLHSTRLAEWAASVHDRIGCDECWPELPEGVADRPADVWEPLLIVAELAGGLWPERGRRACIAFVQGARDDTASVGVRLLTDLRAVFGDAHAMSTKAVLAALHRLDESPWGDWHGRPLTARDLARLLKPYEVEPKLMKIAGNVARGYRRDDLHGVWRRYGASAVTSVTSVTDLASTVTEVTGLTDDMAGDEMAQAEQLIMDMLGGEVMQALIGPGYEDRQTNTEEEEEERS